MTAAFSPQDLEDIRARGLTPEEVSRQESLLRKSPPPPVLSRPCTVGDGILRLERDEAASLIHLFDKARFEGRLSKFVPASGAASRMFKSFQAVFSRRPDITRDALEREAAGGDADAVELLRFVQGLPRFAFYDALRDQVRRSGADPDAALAEGRLRPWLEALLTDKGLALPSLPKALIPFHKTLRGEVRTPLEEHMIESVETLRDGSGLCRLHFTASPEHEALFRAKLAEASSRLEASRHVRFQAGISFQKPSTETVSLEGDALARRPDGRLLFRPGGHGALVENLGDLNADLVFIKNIDNVGHESHPGETSHWDALLAGLLVSLQSEVFHRVSWLTTRPADERLLAEAEEFAARRLNILLPSDAHAMDQSARRERLLSRLKRPIRVCAVVKNTGEPGGGPFWVRGAGGALDPQVVEAAQVSSDPGQRRVFRASTHFNPVQMVCGLKDWRGENFDLRAFSDPSAVFVTEKSAGGRPLRVLELPGLWNGGMGRWTTVFLEAPLSLFHPVKTLNDLLRPDHQPS